MGAVRHRRRCRRRRAEWQAVLAGAVRSPGSVPVARTPPRGGGRGRAGGRRFPLLVPRPWLARIRRAIPADPLLLQILPAAEELADMPRFQADPLGEAAQCGAPVCCGNTRADS